MRPRHDNPGHFARQGQHFATTRVHNPHLHIAQAGRDPAFEIAPVDHEVGDKVAKLDDEQR